MDVQPKQIYYPAARVRLHIRLEDFGATDTPTPPTKPPQLRDGQGDPALSVKEETSRDGASFLILAAKSGQLGVMASQSESNDQRTHTIEGVVPVNVAHARNGIRIADTLRATFMKEDFPFDPRLIRSCGVEYYLGCVTPEDFSSAVAEGKRFNDGQPSLAMIPDSWIDSRGRTRSNLRFQGWVDEWSLEAADGSAQTVTIECTDQTRLLIDQPAPPKLTIGTAEPIDRAIANYLANFPQYEGFGVQYRPTSATNRPTLKDVLAKSAFKPTLGPSPNGGDKLAVWDYVTDICGACGHVCYVDVEFKPDGSAIPVVVIQRPRTLFGEKFSGRENDPFTGRRLPNGREVIARTFTYGINVIGFSMSRKLSCYDPQSIEVRCWSPRLKKTLVARFPLPAKKGGDPKTPKKLAPGNTADQKWEVVRVQGIEDEATLRLIAQSVFEQRRRNELTVNISTKNLGSLGGSNMDPDVLDLMASDVIEMETRQFDEDEVDFQALDPAAHLEQLGYSPDLAQAYARASANQNFPTSFRVRQMATTWSRDEGVAIDIEGCNYMEVEIDLPNDEEQTADTSGSPEPEQITVEE